MTWKDFWHNLLPIEPGNITFENKSIDVTLKDCFENYDTTACVRNSVLAFSGFLSFLLCLIRIVKLHVLHHQQIHQYLIFYLASIEVIFLIVKWIALMSWYQLEFFAYYLKMVQFILLCHFHWSLVSRILHRQRLINWIIMPLLGVFLAIFSLITVLGLLSHVSHWVACFAPHWVLLSLSEFLCIQLYVIAGIYITKNINTTSSLDSFKWEQKRDLWSVIVTYEISSVISLSYYATLLALGDPENGCSGIFAHTQDIYSPVCATIAVVKYLGPIWIMLLIFYPTSGVLSSEDQRLLGWSGDGSTTSVFTPGTRFSNSYKQPASPSQSGIISPVNNEYPVFRRSESSPAFFSKSPLYSISEGTVLSPARVPVANYGTMDSYSAQAEVIVHDSRRVRSRHDSGMPSKSQKIKKLKVVSLNQCSDEMESVTSSSVEQA